MKTTSALIAILTALVLLGAVNLLAARHPLRLDLTAGGLYTISPSTEAILANLDDVVTIRAYFTSQMPSALADLRRDVEDLLADFKVASGDRLQVQFIDPGASAAEEQQAAMIGIQPVQLNVVENDKSEVAKVFLGIAVLYGGRQQVIPVVARVDNLEYDLAETILKVALKKLPRVAWWEGGDAAPGDGFGLVRESLARRYEVTRIDAKTLAVLDATQFQALILASPRDLTGEELFAIDQYLMGGGRILAFVDRFDIGEGLRFAAVTTPAVDLVRHYGATIEDALVVDQQNAMATFAGGPVTYHLPYPYWPDVRRAQFAADDPAVAGLESLVLPWTSPLVLAGGDSIAETLAASSPMAAAVPGAELKLDPQSAGEALRNGPRGPKALAAMLSGPFGSYAASGKVAVPKGRDIIAESGPEARLVVVGSSHWLTDRLLTTFPQNATFFENALDALAMGDLLIGIRSRENTQRPIAVLPDGARLALKAINLGLGPLVLCIAGVIIFVVQRARRRRARHLYR